MQFLRFWNAQTMQNLLCQACLISPPTQEVLADEQAGAYFLCKTCAYRLEQRALRPLEWYRLAALYGPFTYLLHDDFYDEDGSACQNEIPVEQAHLFPIPKLEAVSGSLSELLDYSMTRWNLNDDILLALSHFPNDVLLGGISQLKLSRQNPWVEDRFYQIAARVLGPAARGWISGGWETGTRDFTLFSFLEAAAKCLPHTEAIPKAVAAIEAKATGDISTKAMALVWFNSPLILDWIEKTVSSPVSNRWGWLAARSGFSWHLANQWLEKGRPLSLVAFDALENVMRPSPPSRLTRPAPVLTGAPSTADILKRLRAHAQIDPVPRIAQAIDRIARNPS
jgi:hypothetical protein